jgi:hypothetical protein
MVGLSWWSASSSIWQASPFDPPLPLPSLNGYFGGYLTISGEMVTGFEVTTKAMLGDNEGCS